MSIHKYWQRWTFASVCKHFESLDTTDKKTLYIEGLSRSTEEKDFIELRMDGPYFTEVSKDCWKLTIEINLLIQSVKDDKNFHRLYDNIGLVTSKFTPIRIFRYGDSNDDSENDGTLLGCIDLVPGFRGRDPIIVSNFGLVDPKLGLLQATVEGHYNGYLNS